MCRNVGATPSTLIDEESEREARWAHVVTGIVNKKQKDDHERGRKEGETQMRVETEEETKISKAGVEEGNWRGVFEMIRVRELQSRYWNTLLSHWAIAHSTKYDILPIHAHLDDASGCWSFLFCQASIILTTVFFTHCCWCHYDIPLWSGFSGGLGESVRIPEQVLLCTSLSLQCQRLENKVLCWIAPRSSSTCQQPAGTASSFFIKKVNKYWDFKDVKVNALLWCQDTRLQTVVVILTGVDQRGCR